MSLLREIQSAAIDSSIPLASLLRKCKVLAARLGNEAFRVWIDKELNGYELTNDLPSYRVVRVTSKGHFSGRFQSALRNADIPMTCMPEGLRETLSHTYFMSPIAALEALVTGDANGNLCEAWNPDIVAHYGDNIYHDMNCLQAWKVIPPGAVVAALDTVRTRILNFALEIEAEAPEAGEAPLNSNPVPQDRVLQIFNTNISGNVQNIANASPGVHQQATYNEQDPDLFRDLLQAVERSGADAEVVESVKELVIAMGSATSPRSFRESYRRFMSVTSDHMQVFGVVIAPYLPLLTNMLG